MAEFQDEAECPCLSGALVRDCTCKPRRFVPLPVCSLPPGDITGEAVPGCYASSTRNCSPPLTGEHPVSRIALNYLSNGRRSVGVSNHPWQGRKAEISARRYFEPGFQCAVRTA